MRLFNRGRNEAVMVLLYKKHPIFAFILGEKEYAIVRLTQYIEQPTEALKKIEDNSNIAMLATIIGNSNPVSRFSNDTPLLPKYTWLEGLNEVHDPDGDFQVYTVK